MTHISATWNPEESPETSVKFHRSFDKLTRIDKLDFLKDAIYDLEEKYNFIIGIKEIA